jgi:hypothetical protein
MPDMASTIEAYAGHERYGLSPVFPNPETER